MSPPRPEQAFTIIDAGRVCTTTAVVDGDSVRLSADALAAALGWELKPQGLCKGDRCVPVRGAANLVTSGGIDLTAFTGLLERPLAVDVEEGVAYVGTAAATRAADLSSLVAPDFTLPDLNGQLHSLAAQRGKKVLLVAYASW